MKTLRQVCAATILSLTLAVSAFAGDIHSPAIASTSTGATALTDVTTIIFLTVINAVYI